SGETEQMRLLPSSSMAGHTTSTSVSSVFAAIGRRDDEDIEADNIGDEGGDEHELPPPDDQGEDYEQEYGSDGEHLEQQELDDQDNGADEGYEEEGEAVQEAAEEDDVAQSVLGHLHSVEEVDE